MWCAGKRVGFLSFDTARVEKCWSEDDIALLRTVGEIFANALERRQAETERETLEARLHQSQKLEAIGTLAGGIAHDFNNILGAILGYGEMALTVVSKGSNAERYMQQIMMGGERAKGIVDQILAFSRHGQHERLPIRIQPLIEEAVDLLRASLPTTVAIRLRLEAEDATVLGDSTQLYQMVMNLCTNAAQAMQEYGTLDVALETAEIVDDQALTYGSLTVGPYVRLTVSDTGHGMDDETMERIFDPFFTTKAAHRGTGLGLSMVHGIVLDHGGAINVRSRPGKGSTFEVYLVRVQGTSVVGDDEAEVQAPCGHGETILLVDDETPLVRLGEEMLAALGYEPVGFDTSTRALEAFRADPQRFDLVLTDEVMPQMTGTQLAVALHRIRPELPVILMTGYSEPVRLHLSHIANIQEILKKPLRSLDIAKSIARHLDLN